ncbi:MAG TPA: TadE family protein [Terriglobales bacterium]|nr:TadE family protein [Terriglobales bacterium]
MAAIKRRQKGQSVVEAALVLPILALVLFGIVEIGHAASLWQTLDNAAREGARWSAMPSAGSNSLPSPGDVVARVETYAADAGLTLSDDDVTVNQAVSVSEGGLPTSFSQVDVSYTDTFVTPLLSEIVSGITLNAHAIMRNETN